MSADGEVGGVGSEAFGQALRRLRTARGLSLRDVGSLVSYSRQYIHDLETGRRRALPDLASALDQALCAEGGLTRLAIARAGPAAAGGSSPLASGIWRTRDAEALAGALTAGEPTAENALRLAHEWLVTEPPQHFERRSGPRIGAGLVTTVEARVHQIRLIDDHVGGLETWAMATSELAATAKLLRDASYTEETGARLLAAVGQLCQIAGWIASDAGRCGEAERLYLSGARAAHAAGDVPGAASNLSSLAYQTANVGIPRDAVMLARTAYLGAERVTTPGARALLLERVAWAEARAGDASAAERTLDQVDDAYVGHDPATEPIWVYWLTPQEVEVMSGRVWTELRHPLRAVPALEHAISRYGDDIPRETALYLTWLAESLVHANEVERAAQLALDAVRLSRRAHSVRTRDRIGGLRRLLEPWRGQATVDAFREEARQP